MRYIISHNLKTIHFRFYIFNSASKLELYIAGDGFTLPSCFILKELTILLPDREFKHFIFKQPDWFCPTAQDNITIRYTTTYLNQLSFTAGDIPYNIIDGILTPYKDYKIYTYSAIIQNYLQNILPTTTIINIQLFGYKLPPVLPKPNCFKNHNPRYCSLAKVKAVCKFVEAIKYIEE